MVIGGQLGGLGMTFWIPYTFGAVIIDIGLIVYIALSFTCRLLVDNFKLLKWSNVNHGSFSFRRDYRFVIFLDPTQRRTMEAVSSILLLLLLGIVVNWLNWQVAVILVTVLLLKSRAFSLLRVLFHKAIALLVDALSSAPHDPGLTGDL